MSAQTKVTSFGQLKAGCVIKIYPKGKYGISHYYESEYALACSGDEQHWKTQETAFAISRTIRDVFGRTKEVLLLNP